MENFPLTVQNYSFVNLKAEPTPVNLLTTCDVHGTEAESEQREGNVLAIALKQLLLESLQQLRDRSRRFISVLGFFT